MLRSPVGGGCEAGGSVVRSSGFGGGGVGSRGTGGLVSNVEFLMPYLKYIIKPEMIDMLSFVKTSRKMICENFCLLFWLYG